MVSNSADNQPNSLLVEFLEDDRSDVSFARIVKATAGLVHSSAFRRTGNASLAEEVTQNVYIILARKAESLRKHPSLTAWLYRTTSYEAEKVMRREDRHHRRVEKFISESPSSSFTSERNEDNLRLLEQAVDRLGKRDQALVLARFFERKKFQEIAASMNQSEAACKMRLRRVMDKMATWLSARGCTMSVAALASILTSEWSRACPVSLSSQSSSFLQTAPVSQSLLITKIITSMKISKMTFAGLALLIGAGATSVTLMKEESEPPQKTTAPSISPVSASQSQENQSTGRKRQRSPRSFDQLLNNYPFAFERLEEIYAKYPDLRIAKFISVEGEAMADSLNQYFESLDKGVPIIPDWVKLQLRGKEEWDQEKIGIYLEENDELLARLLEISKLPKSQTRFRYRVAEEVPEMMHGFTANGLLRVALIYQIREGNVSQAKEIYRAAMDLSEGVSKPFVIQAIGRNGMERNVFGSLRDLAQEGYDISFHTNEISGDDLVTSFSDALRLEAGSFISLIEATKPFDEDRELLSRGLASIMPMSTSDATPSLEDQRLMQEVGMTMEIEEFQEIYAEAFSDYLVEMNQWLFSEDSEIPTMAIDLEETDLPRGKALILNRFLPRVEMMIKQILKRELLMREVTTWNALNQAVAAGHDPKEIADLVPEFLDEIPVNPMTHQAFSLDVENRNLVTKSE